MNFRFTQRHIEPFKRPIRTYVIGVDRVSIHITVYHKQRSQALSLAAKYHDFGILIEICEETGDQEGLQRYTNQFRDQVRLGEAVSLFCELCFTEQVPMIVFS